MSNLAHKSTASISTNNVFLFGGDGYFQLKTPPSDDDFTVFWWLT